MDLRQFRYFCQVARRENFRKASEDLRIAQVLMAVPPLIWLVSRLFSVVV